MLWGDRWLAFRDRLLASSAFQRGATAFPLTRFIAHRRARELFDLCGGFVYSQVLLACVRLGVVEKVRDGPLTTTEFRRRLDLPAEAADRLLKAAASLRLLSHRSGNRYGLGDLGAALLGNPGIAELVEHHTYLYADLADPVALLRGETSRTQMADYWPYAAADDPAVLGKAAVARYTAVMAASQVFIAAELLAAWPFGKYRSLLDVGGGNGRFLAAVAARYPHLALTLFDLPAVTAVASQNLAAQGLADRVALVGGDFYRDRLPVGADLITLVRVLHDHDDPGVLAILRAVRQALPASGTLLVAEPMAGTAGAEPVGDAYFGMYLLAMGAGGRRGRARTPAEIRALAEESGFRSFRLMANRSPLLARLAAIRP